MPYLTWQEFKDHRAAGTLASFGTLYSTIDARFEYASWLTRRKYQLEYIRLRSKVIWWALNTRYGWIVDKVVQRAREANHE